MLGAYLDQRTPITSQSGRWGCGPRVCRVVRRHFSTRLHRYSMRRLRRTGMRSALFLPDTTGSHRIRFGIHALHKHHFAAEKRQQNSKVNLRWLTGNLLSSPDDYFVLRGAVSPRRPRALLATAWIRIPLLWVGGLRLCGGRHLYRAKKFRSSERLRSDRQSGLNTDCCGGMVLLYIHSRVLPRRMLSREPISFVTDGYLPSTAQLHVCHERRLDSPGFRSRIRRSPASCQSRRGAIRILPSRELTVCPSTSADTRRTYASATNRTSCKSRATWMLPSSITRSRRWKCDTILGRRKFSACPNARVVERACKYDRKVPVQTRASPCIPLQAC